MKRIVGIFLVLLMTAMVSCSDKSKDANIIYKAYEGGKPIPLISETRPDFNEKMAYDVQTAYVKKRLKKCKILGFKAGLTSTASQKKFAVTEPASGVLFEKGMIKPGGTVDSSKIGKLMLETEIGFIAEKVIKKPVKDVEELKGLIKAVVPVIEMPDIGFEDVKKIQGIDLIAANVASSHYIMGPEFNKDTDVNSIDVTLRWNDALINVGKGSDALGDQWKALLWLVNNTIKNGWVVKPGELLITGSLGKMLPGKPGSYVANFGPLGEIKFSVK